MTKDSRQGDHHSMSDIDITLTDGTRLHGQALYTSQQMTAEGGDTITGTCKVPAGIHRMTAVWVLVQTNIFVDPPPKAANEATSG